MITVLYSSEKIIYFLYSFAHLKNVGKSKADIMLPAIAYSSISQNYCVMKLVIERYHRTGCSLSAPAL